MNHFLVCINILFEKFLFTYFKSLVNLLLLSQILNFLSFIIFLYNIFLFTLHLLFNFLIKLYFFSFIFFNFLFFINCRLIGWIYRLILNCIGRFTFILFHVEKTFLILRFWKCVFTNKLESQWSLLLFHIVFYSHI